MDCAQWEVVWILLACCEPQEVKLWASRGQQQVEREPALGDVEGVKYCWEAGAGVGLVPRLVSSRRGHHVPP